MLVTSQYFEHLTEGGVAWGFFSGATRGSAKFILEQRLGLVEPLLIAMHDAPSKPDPTGFFQAAERLGSVPDVPILYAGDTVADMQTVQRAKDQRPDGVGIGWGNLCCGIW